MIDELAVDTILKELSKGDYACLSSEAQLRDAFAITLVKKFPNCVVYPEYTQSVPQGWKCSEKLIHFDLLVEDKDSNETILFEFKYKTKTGDFNLGRSVIYLKEHKDTFNGRYSVWRDIYRIETFVNLKKITKGFIVFVTNHSSYYASATGVSEQFSLQDGKFFKAGKHYWNVPAGKVLDDYKSINSSYRNDKQPLEIENNYSFKYDTYSTLVDTNGKTHTFKQLVLLIK